LILGKTELIGGLFYNPGLKKLDMIEANAIMLKRARDNILATPRGRFAHAQ
jgi:hypothetical protein